MPSRPVMAMWSRSSMSTTYTETGTRLVPRAPITTRTCGTPKFRLSRRAAGKLLTLPCAPPAPDACAFSCWRHCAAVSDTTRSRYWRRPSITEKNVTSRTPNWLLLAESHLTLRLFGSMLPTRISSHPPVAGVGCGEPWAAKSEVSVRTRRTSPSLRPERLADEQQEVCDEETTS